MKNKAKANNGFIGEKGCKPQKKVLFFSAVGKWAFSFDSFLLLPCLGQRKE